MIPFTRLAALLLLPSLSLAQNLPTEDQKQETYDAQGHLERKAKRILKNEGVTIKAEGANGKVTKTSGDLDDLTKNEERIIVQAIANKLRVIRRNNWQFWKKGKSRMKFSDADVTIYITDKDLDELHAKFDKQIKNNQVVSKGEDETATPPLHVEDPPKILPIESHSEPAYQNLFADNKWEIQDTVIKTDEYPDGINPAQELRDQIDDFLKDLGTDGKITGLTLHSSASTLNNTATDENGNRVEMSWLKLSEYRYRATLKFILQYLKSKGVTLDPSMTDDPKDTENLPWAGENGDGTSGPSAPIINGVRVGSAGNGEAPLVKEAGDTYEALYAPYRYVDVMFFGTVFASKGEPTFTDVPQDSEWSSRLVDLKIDTTAKKRWWKFQKKTRIWIGHKHPKRNKLPKKKGHHRAVLCPGEAKTAFGRLLQKVFGQHKTGF